jgi:hypothetical protein
MSDTIKDKSDSLNVDGELKLSFLAGLVSVRNECYEVTVGLIWTLVVIRRYMLNSRTK